jgi:hypothetical protein
MKTCEGLSFGCKQWDCAHFLKQARVLFYFDAQALSQILLSRVLKLFLIPTFSFDESHISFVMYQ